MTDKPASSPTPGTRRQRTRWIVRAADVVSKACITIGGIGTIAAVSAVFVFLVVVVVPLFESGKSKEIGAPRKLPESARILKLGVDEYRTIGWTLHADGNLRVFRLDDGEELRTGRWVNPDSISAWSLDRVDGRVAFGRIDGSFQLGDISFKTDFLSDDAIPDSVRSAKVGDRFTLGDGVVEKTPEGQFRRQRVHATLDPVVEGRTHTPVVLIDHVPTSDGFSLVALTRKGLLEYIKAESIENIMTGEVEYETSGGDVDTEIDPSNMPNRIVVSQSGTSAFLIWKDGRIRHFDLRDTHHIVAAGVTRLTEDSNTVTAYARLIGGATFLIGTDDGTVSAMFRYKDESAMNTLSIARAHTFKAPGRTVTALAPSPRARVFAAGYDDGSVRVYQATSEARIVSFDVPGGRPVEELAIAPKSDALIIVTDKGIYHYSLSIGHPEATLSSLFRPVWYEGYSKPIQMWQSSSGTDDFEPKLGLWPLIFGTLKATFYSMLFAIPIALLAAIYTSEFLTPTLRSPIKTLIEAMASLPSVVLGFLASLVFAPYVQAGVLPCLLGVVVVPSLFIMAAQMWQLLPQHIALRFDRLRLPAAAIILPIGVLIAIVLGPVVEKALFAGDMMLWLDGQKGAGFGGWLILLFPFSALAVVWAMTRWISPRMQNVAASGTRKRVAILDLSRFVIGFAAAVVLTAVFAGLFQMFGLDPRGPSSPLYTYVQRNALVVGFVMGFAVIPIIYTIAEDALSAVPEHLRAASLGAGATPWQTATRIVLPTAMSGLFSAIMIGLGRAVGETMIVLMAAGNTPILQMNIFNGFRTLSANIAVELPEAVRDSTHYRTLFLAALILFLMTFVINSVAEAVRMRFRKRSAQI